MSMRAQMAWKDFIFLDLAWQASGLWVWKAIYEYGEVCQNIENMDRQNKKKEYPKNWK